MEKPFSTNEKGLEILEKGLSTFEKGLKIFAKGCSKTGRPFSRIDFRPSKRSFALF
jgi:hypothetical protein